MGCRRRRGRHRRAGRRPRRRTRASTRSRPGPPPLVGGGELIVGVGEAAASRKATGVGALDRAQEPRARSSRRLRRARGPAHRATRRQGTRSGHRTPGAGHLDRGFGGPSALSRHASPSATPIIATSTRSSSRIVSLRRRIPSSTPRESRRRRRRPRRPRSARCRPRPALRGAPRQQLLEAVGVLGLVGVDEGEVEASRSGSARRVSRPPRSGSRSARRPPRHRSYEPPCGRALVEARRRSAARRARARERCRSPSSR